MKVLYAGDACTKIGPVFVASPFNLEVKGVSHHIWGQPLIDALTAGGIEVKHRPSCRRSSAPATGSSFFTRAA